jgi:hypothetical protein
MRFLAACLLLTACATAAPEAPPEVAVSSGDPRVEAVLAMVREQIAADPTAVPPGLDVSLDEPRESAGQLVMEATFLLPEAKARDAQDFTVYAACPSTDLAACAGKLMEAARSLKRRR